MTSVVASLFADKILRAAERLVSCLDGLDDVATSAVPHAGANSIAGIVNHALSNIEDNVLAVIGGSSASRDRSIEFDPEGGPTGVVERWTLLRPRIAAILDATDDPSLYRLVHHERRGEITVAELLMVILRHLGEHEGEAMLTRSLIAKA
ncbi:MAG: DinB family protein [Dehalococcoidia bacterium]|nr:DinB family protein [Thermoflexaceae bacterium]